MSTNSPLFKDKYYKVRYCRFTEHENQWKCERCQIFISKNIAQNTPPHCVCRLQDLDSIGVQSEPIPGQKTVVRQNLFDVKKIGPGTMLKNILSTFGIKATAGCSCNAKANIMDEKGIEWCENNIDTIVGWLREESQKRGLPFVNSLGKLLVKKAIKNAKRQQ